MFRKLALLLWLTPLWAGAQRSTSRARALKAGVDWVSPARPCGPWVGVPVGLHAPRRSWAAGHLASLCGAVGRAIADDARWLRAPIGRDSVTVFFLDDADDLRPLVGTPALGWSIITERTAYLVANARMAPALHHELMHILSWTAWGPPATLWISEGVATRSSDGCRGYDWSQVGTALRRADLLPGVDSLQGAFHPWGDGGLIDGLAAASLVQSVDAREGRAAVRRLWRGGRVEYRETVEWERTLFDPHPPRALDLLAALKRQGCD